MSVGISELWFMTMTIVVGKLRLSSLLETLFARIGYGEM